MPNTSLAEHCQEIARRFLLTAVAVDDELSVSVDPPVRGNLVKPGRGAATRAPRPATSHPYLRRSLEIRPLTWSFARQGMVCGVVSPQEEQGDHRALAKAVAGADIVILDWKLNPKRGEDAAPLLEQILSQDQANRLRLIAFYTGEPNHHEVRKGIRASLRSLDATDQADFTGGDDHGPIDFRGCRIVLYAKPDSSAPKPVEIVREKDLANRLIADFADMVEGLLPSLVLTALAAVRENVYEVLQRFGEDLDPAFLTHRACLPQPADSEQHIVEQIASELRAIMDDVVTRRSPAGIEAIKRWLKGRFGNDPVAFGNGKEMSQQEVLEMLKHGVEKKRGPFKKDGKDYHVLSGGFSRCPEDGRELDLRLASAMSLRQVLADTERQLSMGTVVQRIGEAPKTLLCVTPKCDSVRLPKRSSFLFVPLSKPESRTPKVVVPEGGNGHRLMTISMKPSGWCMADFDPDPDRQCVIAHWNGGDQVHTFKDACGREYRWVGELKQEFAQSIAQAIAERTSRMPLDMSEWLRRSERSSKR
ncbi:MAG: response regulator receiver domain [Bryobacterales bacterium]|nr:response regulator receiver domain [Bryobacterales bacterium]